MASNKHLMDGKNIMILTRTSSTSTGEGGAEERPEDISHFCGQKLECGLCAPVPALT